MITQRPYRIGIIGLGHIARVHALALEQIPQHFTLWSVCGHGPSAPERWASLGTTAQPHTIVHTNIDTFLRDPELEAVIIATPDADHATHAIQALEAGKHVLVEKPMCLHERDALRLARVAESVKRQLMVGYHLRHQTDLQNLAQAMPSMLGNVSAYHLIWTLAGTFPQSWRASSAPRRNILIPAIGSHALDLVQWLFGAHRKRITQIQWTQDPLDTPTQAVFLLNHEDGMIGTIHLSHLVPIEKTRSIHARGTQGTLNIHGILGDGAQGIIEQTRHDDLHHRWTVQGRQPYREQLIHFAHRIRLELTLDLASDIELVRLLQHLS